MDSVMMDAELDTQPSGGMGGAEAASGAPVALRAGRVSETGRLAPGEGVQGHQHCHVADVASLLRNCIA